MDAHSMNLGRLLVVDDDAAMLAAICNILSDQNYEVMGVETGRKALDTLKEKSFDLLLTDMKMPEMDGISLLREAVEIDPYLVGIVMTGHGTIETAVEAMKVGAFDYVLKPFKLSSIMPVLARAMEVRRLRLENVQLRETLAIYELSLAVASNLDLNTILNKAADAALQGAKGDEVSIMLPTRDGRELCVVVVRGESRQNIVGQRVPIGEGIAGWVVSNREPLMLHGEIGDARFTPVRPRDDIRSSISLPMLAGGKLVGVLNVNATKRLHPFTLGEMKALNISTSIAASSLDGAMLYQQVKCAEAKYRAIFEHSIEGIFQTTPDPRGNYLAANPALARMLGYNSPEELMSTLTDISTQLYVNPDRRSEFIRRVRENGFVSGFEAQVRRKDGSLIWISENARLVADDNGKVIYYEGSCEDITPRRMMEEALKKERDFISAVLDTAGALVVVLDPEGRIVRFNRACEELSGYGFEEAEGRCIWDFLLLPEEIPYIKTTVEELNAGRFPNRHENYWLSKDGHKSLVAWSNTVLLDPEGHVQYIVATGIDITERKQAEVGLEQQLARISLLNHITRAIAERQDLNSIFRVVMRHLEDHLPIPFGCIHLYDPVKNVLSLIIQGPKSRLVAAKLGIPESTAASSDGVLLSNCIQGGALYIPDTEKTEEPCTQKLARAGIRSLVAIPLAVESKLLGILAVTRCEVDGFSIEERDFLKALSEHVSLAAHQVQLYEDLQKAYEELHQTQQAVMQQERLRALGQMASGIVHDINNALGPVVGYTDMLLEFEKDLSDSARSYLKTIRTAGADITHIVARMREFYRKREEQDKLYPLNLNRLVKEVIKLTAPRWKNIPQEHGIVIDIQTDLQMDLPTLMGIESEIREALTNLIFNAVDAMPTGGELTIRTYASSWVYNRFGGCSATSMTPPASMRIILEVSDNGVGMDEETKRRCLEPFYSTKGERGTGLGLAMAYGVAQRHEGEIEIADRPGGGTTMRMLFPLMEPMNSIAVSQAVSEEAIPPLRILCIDDEPAMQKLIKAMLEKGGHTVDVADGGQAGLDAFRAAKERGEMYDVIFTDLGMPYVDGREVIRAVKRELTQTPVVLLTGWGGRMNAEGKIPEQADYVLSKPPTLQKMWEVLQQIMKNYRKP